MNRKISVGMAVTIVILAMTVTFSITMLIAMRLFDSTVSSVKEKESMYNKVAEVDRYVRSNDYYTIDETVLYDRLTAGYLLGTGDKYARYYTANAYTELMNQQSGKVMGIGVELGMDQTGYARVTRVYEDSPAQEAGIVVGDYITAIDGTDVKSLSGVDAVQSRLQGEAGTIVNVTWLDSKAASRTTDLTHSGYTSTTVDYQMLDSVGYIKIRQFDGSDDESKVELPIVCLVNGNTASAAELFAASLRTMNGARLVGTTTMGKGTIQSSPQRLSDGSAVSITVAKLICGDGSCFDGTGLSVDVERALSAEETTNFYDYTPEDDPQIQRAVSAAQQLSGTTTLGGVNEAASSAAASEEADSAATEPENASSEETASSTEAEAGGEAASSAE